MKKNDDMVVIKGKLLNVAKLEEDAWTYAIWGKKGGLLEVIIRKKVHFQIIEREGEIIGRELKLIMDKEKNEMSLMFD